MATSLAYDLPVIENYRQENSRYAIYRQASSSGSSGERSLTTFMTETVSTGAFFVMQQFAYGLLGELNKLRELKPNWDSYGAEVPSAAAIALASKAIEQHWPLFRIALPSAVRPSAEGGVAICFARNDNQGELEFTNDGQIFGLTYGLHHAAESWCVKSFADLNPAWERIGASLQR